MSRTLRRAAAQLPLAFAGYDDDGLARYVEAGDVPCEGAEPGDFIPLPTTQEEIMHHAPAPAPASEMQPREADAVAAQPTAVNVDHISPSAHPRILAFDFETVPQPTLYWDAMASGDDSRKAEMLAIAGSGDKDAQDRLRRLLPGFRPGNSRLPDALSKKVVEYFEEYAESVAGMSMDPMRLAICTASLYTEGLDGGRGFVFSWGSQPSSSAYTDVVTGREMLLQTDGLADPSAEPMTYEAIGSDWMLHERFLLLSFWDVLAQFRNEFITGAAVLASHNGAAFDVPALRFATIRHRHKLVTADGFEYPPVRPTVSWRHIEPQRYRTRPHIDTMLVASNWSGKLEGFGLEAVSACVGLPIRKHDGMTGREVFPAALSGEWSRIDTYCLGDACTVYGIADAFLDGGL